MSTYLHSTDEELLDLIKKEDKHAFSELYNRYKKPLVALALSKIDNEQVEDIVHDLFVKIWSNRQQIQINLQFRAYIYRALRNKILDFIAHQSHERKYLDSLMEFHPIYLDSTDYHIREKQFLLELDKLMNKYSNNDKAILKLRMQGYSNNEIAEQLGLSEKTIRNRYSLILKSLEGKIKLLSIFFLF